MSKFSGYTKFTTFLKKIIEKFKKTLEIYKKFVIIEMNNYA